MNGLLYRLKLKIYSKVRKYRSKVIAGFLIFASVSNLCVPLAAQGLELSGSIGTNAALGSPLLNDASWGSEDWNPYELVTFGVFLSNFTVPMVDDYKSAFQKGFGGSGGKGQEALQFSVESDSQATEILNPMLSYAIKMQTKSLKEIKVVYHDLKLADKLEDNVGGLTAENTKDAKPAVLSDLFPEVKWKLDDISNKEKGYVTGVADYKAASGDGSNITVQYATEFRLPEFFISASNSKPVTVLNYTDGYDPMAVEAAILGAERKSEYGKTVDANLNKAKDSPIYLDSFGNIVTNLDGKTVVVLPASANQHLTKEKKINLLTNVFMQNSYLQASDASLIEGAYSGISHGIGSTTKYYMGTNPLVGYNMDDSRNYSTILYTDTQQFIFDSALSKIKEGTGVEDALSQAVNEDSGKNLITLATKKLTKENINLPFRVGVIGGDGVLGSDNKITNARQSSGEGIGASFAALVGANSSSADDHVMLGNLALANNLINNWFPVNTNTKVANAMITLDDKKQLISDQTYFAQAGTAVLQNYVNFATGYLNASSEYKIADSNVPDQSKFKDSISTAGKPEELSAALLTDNATSLDANNQANGLYKYWAVNEGKSRFSDRININAVGSNVSLHSIEPTITNPVYKLLGYRVSGIYNSNSAMKTAAGVLNINEGMQFAAYTPYIYLTYLDFYGIMNGKNNFDTDLFGTGDVISVKSEDLFEGTILSEEDKKKQITNYTYKFLDIKGGASYRKQLANNFITELLYDNYKKIVFGTDSSTISSSIATNNSEGFLSVNSLSDNMFIGKIFGWYLRNIVILAGVLLIISFISGVVQGSGVVGIFTSVVSTLAMLLLIPTLIDVVPYICNNTVQGMFARSMKYWAISESIDNQSIAQEFNGSKAGDADVNTYIRMLNITQLNKTIMIKNDISKKIVPSTKDIDYNKLQKLKTTRWLLPAVMRQLTADDKSANYVYTTLSDLYQNFSNMYWYYRTSSEGGDKPSLDMQAVGDYNAKVAADVGVGKAAGANEENVMSESKKQTVFVGYRPTRPTGDKEKEFDYHSLSRDSAESEDLKALHNSFYIMNFGSAFTVENPLRHTESGELDTAAWNDYAAYIKGEASSNGNTGFADTVNNKILPMVSQYSPMSTPVQQCFGYFWMTESPAHYFYEVTKDTFENGMTVGGLIYQLQGTYAPITDKYDLDKDGDTSEVYTDMSGKEQGDAHHTFMRDSATGKIRDFLDMEELFTNVIPYMYNVQVMASGNDDGTGFLGDAVLGSDYSVYEKNKKYWLFRSNWVNKIVEDRSYRAKATIGYYDESGNKATAVINSSIDPSSYEKYRKMVFSEAQMEQMRLTEQDLSIVELRILEVNRRVEKEWTSLINYSSTDKLSAEVLYRQMAIDALLTFDKVFSSGNKLSAAYQLYPTTLDLRNVSFDSVFKLLVMSATNAPQTLNKDTMKVVIENGDMLSTILLLLDAVLGVALAPMLRDLGIAVVTLLFIYELITGFIFKRGNKNQLMAGAAFLFVKVAALTVMYYEVFNLMITVTSPNQVLRLDSNMGWSGHGTWFIFLMIFLASAGYVYALVKFIIIFAVTHRYDMGFEATMFTLNSIAGKTRGILSKVTGIDLGGNAASSSSAESGSGTDSPIRVEGGASVGNGSGDSTVVTADDDESDNSSAVDDDREQSGYSYYENEGSSGSSSASEIDDMIEDGEDKQKEDKENKEDE